MMAVSNCRFDPDDPTQEVLPRDGIVTFEAGGKPWRLPAIEQQSNAAEGTQDLSVIQRPNEILPGSAAAHMRIYRDGNGEFSPKRTGAAVRGIYAELKARA